MPNIKSAKKRAVQNEKKRIRNNERKSAIKTAIKKVMAAIEGKDIDVAQALLKDVQAKLSRAKSKGVIHKNTASRKISRLAKKVSAVAR